MSGLWLASYLVLWVLLLVLAVALLSVLRNVGELAEAIKRPERTTRHRDVAPRERRAGVGPCHTRRRDGCNHHVCGNTNDLCGD